MHYDHLMQRAKPAHRSSAAGTRPLQARRATFREASAWLALGWQAARSQPLLWLGLALAAADCISLAIYAPQLWLFSALIAPAFAGSAAYIQARRQSGQPAALRELAQHLGERHAALLALGVYGIAMVVLGQAALHGLWHALMPLPGGTAGRVLAAALETAPYVLAAAAVWNASVLVMLRGMRPAQALLASTRAALSNWPLTLAALAAGVSAAMLAPQLPAGFGALLLAPLVSAVLLLSAYGAGRDMFERA